MSIGRVASRVRASSLAARLSSSLAASLLCLVSVRTRSTKSSSCLVLLADQRLAEQSDDAPHIGPQRGVIGRRRVAAGAGTAVIGDAPAGAAACGVLVTGELSRSRRSRLLRAGHERSTALTT